MAENFIYVIYAAMVLLLFVLGTGLWTMLKGGQHKKSQRMMRWRLATQAFLLLIVVIFVVFIRGS